MSGIRFAGDINLSDVTLHTSNNTAINIKSLIKTIDIFESIFEPFTTAIITIEDTSDMVGSLGLVGEEVVTMNATTPSIDDPKKQLVFAWHLYKITNRVDSANRASLYQLHCISFEAMINNNRKISKGFNGKISDIVKDILKDETYGLGTKKNVIVEDTSNSTNYVSNLWTPIKNFTFLAGRAVSEIQSPSYVFFENRDGFNFLSLERIYQNPPIQKFIKDNSASNDLSVAYNRITNFEVPSMTNYFDNGHDGMYASTLFTYDLVLKQFVQKEFVTNLDQSSVKLNQSRAIKQITAHPNIHQMVDSKAYQTFSGVDDNTKTDFIQKRKSLLGFSRFHRIVIEVPGRSDYTVGYVADVFIPKNSNLDGSEIHDKLLSGKYIISEIRHSITGAEHKCTMSLIKDSVDD